ncbi:MAG: DUF748 domain-containing protein [candidate division NC10 bacterium]|nr:DUF748 domain-containing protein [candidate division NC10 bacterium]
MTATDPRRWRRWGRGLLALTLLALVGSVVAFQPAVHWVVERELTRVLAARVRIDRLRVSPLRGSLLATGLSIHEKQGGRPLLRIRELAVEVLPSALWRRELLVSRLALEQPEAWVALAPEGLSWLSPVTPAAGASPLLAMTLREVEVNGGRIHIADRRRTPEHRETVEDLDVRVRDLSTREEEREARPALALSGRWRRMAVSAEGWVAPFARERAFHLPVRMARADLGQVAGILPPGLAPAGLAGEAEVRVDVRGQEAAGEWQVQAGLEVEARRVMATPRPDLTVRGASLRIRGRGHWSPKAVGFSQLALDASGATVELGDRLRASLQRLVARGQADLDHRGLLVPEMTVEVTALDLGQAGQPPMIRVGRMAASGGADQRAGTARLERVSLADVTVRAARQPDGSLDIARWWGSAFPPVGNGSNGPAPYWEVLRLEVERAGLEFTDRAVSPERSLAIRSAGVRLAGATSDPAQPITFEMTASMPMAPAIVLSGTWIRVPMRLQVKASIQDLEPNGLLGWLPAAPPVEVSSGRATVAIQADVRSGQDGLAAVGSADLRLHGLQLQAEPLGSFAADDLEVLLSRIQAAGQAPASLRLEVAGQFRGRTVQARLGRRAGPAAAEASAGEIQIALSHLSLAPQQAGAQRLTLQAQGVIGHLQVRAPEYGVDSLMAEDVRAEAPALTASLDPAGVRMDLAGRVSLTRAEGRTPGLPVRTWRAAAILAEVGRLQTAPFSLHLRRVEVDQPEVQALRSGEATAAPASGGGGNATTPVRLDRLIVRKGRIGFRDETVQPAWTGELTQVEAAAEGFRSDADVPASFRFSAKEAGGAEVRLDGRVRPVDRSGEVHAEVRNLDVLRLGPYLPDVIHRVVRGGTAGGSLALNLRQDGADLQIAGRGEVTFAPLELGDAERQLTLLLAEKVQARVDDVSLNPLTLHLSAVRLEHPWVAVGRDRDGSLPALRLLHDLRRAGQGGRASPTVGPQITIGALTFTDGIAEIEDQAVRPRFRDQVRNLEVTIEGLTTEGDRKAGVTLTGELSDRSTVALRGFILPLPANLYLDLEGEIRDFNLHRLNPYATRVTSHRLERGKLFSQVRYRIEQNRLEGENLFRVDQLALGEQVEPQDRFEALVGVPLAVAISLLQDPSGEIVLRVPVHGQLDQPTFDLGEAFEAAFKNAMIQLVSAPFRLIGEIFTLGGRIGAIEIAPVLFGPGSWTLDDAARAHLANIAAVLRDRPTMKVKLSGMAHVDSDEDALRAQKVEAELRRIAREPGVKDREDALDRLYVRMFGASPGAVTREARFARLKTVQRVARREVADLPDARTLSIYDHLAGVEKIERDRMFLAEGKLYRTAEGGGDWARRADFTILQP